MIHSTRPTVSPLANIVFTLFWEILKSGDERTDIQTPRVKIVITTGRDWRLASWINAYSNFELVNFLST